MSPRRPLIGITCGTSSTAKEAARYGINQSYVRAIEAAGGTAILVPPRPDSGASLDLLERLDGLLVPGGADVTPKLYGARPGPKLDGSDPDRDRLEKELTLRALALKMPVLAICRGHQLVNVALGGNLYQDIRLEGASKHNHKTPKSRGRASLAHTIELEDGSRLRAITGRRIIQVNSSHHQAVKDVAPGLRVTARSPDGIIEGLENSDGSLVALQCHPEELTRLRWARDLFGALVSEAARAHR